MTSKELLKKLELKLWSYEAKIRDLEQENIRLKAELVSKNKDLAEKK